MASAEDVGQGLLDPNELSPDGTVSLSSLAVSENGELVAYATSGAGSDWMTWRVWETGTRKDRAASVEWAQYSGASWLHDGSGFCDEAVDPPTPGTAFLAAAPSQKLLLHRLGADGALIELVPDFGAKARWVTNRGSTFYPLTDAGAERQRLVAVELSDPGRESWHEVIADGRLLAVHHCGGRLVCHYLNDACSALAVFDFDGTALEPVVVPQVSSLGGSDEAGCTGRPDQSTLQFIMALFVDSGSL
jgi:prolyl oligopeptidase